MAHQFPSAYFNQQLFNLDEFEDDGLHLLFREEEIASFARG